MCIPQTCTYSQTPLQVFQTLLAQPMAFFDKPGNSAGELITRLANDITLTSRVLIDASAGMRSLLAAVAEGCLRFPRKWKWVLAP